MTTDEKRGKFIVFEGLDGAGKTKHIKLLQQHLAGRGRRVYITAEPTDSHSGVMLRDALAGDTQKAPSEMAALFVLNRIEHNIDPISGILKKLSDGYDVICDRYYYSSLAYQGTETDFDWVMSMNLNCPEILRPDLCIFLDLDPAICMDRIIKGRKTRDIYETQERLEKYRKTYLRAFDILDDEVVIVNTSKSIENTAEKIAMAADAVCL